MTTDTESLPAFGTRQPPPPSDGSANRYQLIAQLATGPFGPLWIGRAATGVEDGRIVLLRRIAKTAPFEDGVFRRAAAAAFSSLDLRDPRLVAALDVVVADGELAIVSEYVEGELLRSLQRRAGLGNKPFELALALRLGFDLVEAAIAAKNGLRSAVDGFGGPKSAHGGLSPDSVLVATYGESVLLDVGVAPAAFSEDELANRADVVGYRAPEQLTNRTADERSDVFTLGVLFWELCANRPLFGSPRWIRLTSIPPLGEATQNTSQEASRARRKVLEMPVPRLDAVVRAGAAVPKDTAAVIARALERKPDRRHPSLEAFRDALVKLGLERLASTDDVGKWVLSLASTSIEARRVALAQVTGQIPEPLESRDETGRTTSPPRAPENPGSTRLDELTSSPEALRALSATFDRPPPLPKRRGSKETKD